MPVPDVIQDNITDATRKMGFDDVHQFFLWASKEHGLNDIHGAAQTAFSMWIRDGYDTLPDYIKDLALKVCEGQYVS